MAVRKEILIGTGLIVGLLGLFLYLVKKAEAVPPIPTTAATIYGTVTDPSGNPIADARVDVTVGEQGWEIWTDNQGEYHYPRITPGIAKIQCVKLDYHATYIIGTTLYAGEAKEVNIVLAPR